MLSLKEAYQKNLPSNGTIPLVIMYSFSWREETEEQSTSTERLRELELAAVSKDLEISRLTETFAKYFLTTVRTRPLFSLWHVLNDRANSEFELLSSRRQSEVACPPSFLYLINDQVDELQRHIARYEKKLADVASVLVSTLSPYLIVGAQRTAWQWRGDATPKASQSSLRAHGGLWFSSLPFHAVFSSDIPDTNFTSAEAALRQRVQSLSTEVVQLKVFFFFFLPLLPLLLPLLLLLLIPLNPKAALSDSRMLLEQTQVTLSALQNPKHPSTAGTSIMVWLLSERQILLYRLLMRWNWQGIREIFIDRELQSWRQPCLHLHKGIAIGISQFLMLGREQSKSVKLEQVQTDNVELLRRIKFLQSFNARVRNFLYWPFFLTSRKLLLKHWKRAVLNEDMKRLMKRL